MAGVYAALWLLGLLAAAPALRTGRTYAFADRLRDALVLGVVIALVLGLAHALYPATCWIALAVCAAIAYRRGGARRNGNAIPEKRFVPYLLVAALALVAWPQVMRPVLDGDSLSYHLPNAAAWVHAHALWTTDPRYWWYPPASELFAAALFAVAGPFAVGWSGFGALALLGFRIAEWARVEGGAPPRLADALAAATVTAAPLALQAGSLQNDVWLAAFFVESLWTLRNQSTAAAGTVALTAILKPYGWIFAAIAAVTSRAPLRVWLAGAGAMALWAAHDVVMWPSAAVSPASTTYANTWDSTILAHGLPAFALLVRVALPASPFVILALIAALAGPVIARDGRRSLGWAAFASVAFFVAMPLAYADRFPQLATGASLRYAAPAIALGAVLLARVALRAPRAATVLLIASALYGAASVIALYWNDAPTRSALGVALLAAGIVAAARAIRSPWPTAAGFAAAVVAGCFLAARHPIDYFVDSLRVGSTSSGVYAWIARTQPAAIGGWGLRIGIVNVLAPAARTLDLPETGTCAAARSRSVALVAVAENGREPSFNAARLRAARACGSVRYDDGIAVVSGF